MALEMQETVIRLDGRKEKFVLGGTWVVIDKSERKKLFQIAKENNAVAYDNLYTGASLLNTPDINEMRAYGLFTAFPKKALSLAHCLANSANSEKIEIDFFTLKRDDGKEYLWVVIIQNRIVQVGGDRFVSLEDSWTLEDQLRAEFQNNEGIEPEIRRHDFQETMSVLSERLDQLSRKELAAAEIISFTGKTKRYLMLATLAAALAGCAFFAWNWWEGYQEEQRLIQEKMDLEAQASRRIDALKRSEFPPVWLSAPMPDMITSAMEDALSRVPLSVNGWTFSSFAYTDNTFSASYTRNESDPYMPPPGKLIRQGEMSIVSWPAGLPRGERKHGIMKKAAGEEWLMKISLGRPWKLSWVLAPRESKDVNVGGSAVTILASYQKFTVEMNEVSTLNGLGHILDVPGFVINSIVWDGNSWSLSGGLYVLP